MKLKTLKDLEQPRWVGLDRHDSSKDIIVFPHHLRQEAIKYIMKRLGHVEHKVTWKIENHLFAWKPNEGFATLTFNDFGRLCEMGFIVNFFNITEGELK